MHYFYILSNNAGTVLSTGVTSDLKRSVEERKAKRDAGATSRSDISYLVYFEGWDEESSAIAREAEIKGLSWLRQTLLINHDNPEWLDLYYELA